MAEVKPWQGLAANCRIVFMDSNEIGYDEFDKITADRALTGAEWAEIQQAMLTDGIFYHDSNYFKVEPYGGFKVIVRAGKFQIKGRWGYIIEDVILDIEPATGAARTDRVVLCMDLTPSINCAYITAKNNTTALENSADVKELGLADLTVSTTSISIKDLRLDPDICGVVDYKYKLDTKAYFDRFDIALADISAQTERQKTDWQAQMTEQQSASDAQLAQQKAAWEEWFAKINVDIQIIATFNFDNLAALKYVTRRTVFETETEIFEEIRTTSGSALIASRHTVEHENGDITQNEIVYDSDGVTILRQSTTEITEDEDGNITEVVS